MHLLNSDMQIVSSNESQNLNLDNLQTIRVSFRDESPSWSIVSHLRPNESFIDLQFKV